MLREAKSKTRVQTQLKIRTQVHVEDTSTNQQELGIIYVSDWLGQLRPTRKQATLSQLS